MSTRHDAGTISSLEDLFLSRAFGHSEEVVAPVVLDRLWLSAEYDPEDVTSRASWRRFSSPRTSGGP